jgi:hypothetical protein
MHSRAGLLSDGLSDYITVKRLEDAMVILALAR